MPKASPNIRSLARAHTATAVATLAGIMRQKKAPAAARVAAASALLDRGWGKPKQPIAGDEETPLLTEIRYVIVDAEHPGGEAV